MAPGVLLPVRQGNQSCGLSAKGAALSAEGPVRRDSRLPPSPPSSVRVLYLLAVGLGHVGHGHLGLEHLGHGPQAVPNQREEHNSGITDTGSGNTKEEPFCGKGRKRGAV